MQLLRIRHAFVESIADLPVTEAKKRCCVTDTPIVRFPSMQTRVTDTKTTVWTKKMCATVSDIQTALRAIDNFSFRFHTFYSERFVAMETLTADI